MAKWVYLFREGDKDMRNLLGGKGANLAEMTNAGLPVPPGFTVTTDACNAYFDAGKQFPEGMWDQVLEAMKTVEEQTGKKFGDPANPLLVSCRSGARVSMPGMMDTVLNIGLNAETLKGMVELTGNERFAWDAYRRFIQMFGNIVKGVDRHAFEYILDEYKAKTKGGKDTDLTTDMLKDVVKDFKALYKKELGEDFPDDPYEQIRQAISATFDAWFSAPATSYRNAEALPHDWGTAVNVQTMVLGNMGEDSGTGVAFTRNPATGEKRVYGEYLLNAQGEDVIAGIRIPSPIADMVKDMPKQYEELLKICDRLERHYRDMQDVEFTIERGKLWMLQTHTGKRTAHAGLRIAIDMLDEKLITEPEAIVRVAPHNLAQLFVPRLPPDLDMRPIAYGLNAYPGVASGMAVFDVDKAEDLGKAGRAVILIRPEFDPDDVHGMVHSQGLISSREGLTSHATVVAKGWKIPCVTGAAAIEIDTELRLFRTSGEVVREGDAITIDGVSGAIYVGEVPLFGVDLQDDPYLMRFASLVWAINSDDYIEDGFLFGHIWLVRDTIRDKSVPLPFRRRPPSSRSLAELSGSSVDDAKYLSFIQPPDVMIHEILSAMHKDHSLEDVVVWGIMDNLARLLENEVGIGRHHLAIRPLVDPERTVISLETQSVGLNGVESSIQLIGIEFFGINRFLRNYLPWGSVQWWVLVNSEPEQSWRLDRVNPEGESIVLGGFRLLGFLAILNDKCLTIMETREFYSELRKRESGWDWYKENNTCWKEVVDTLRGVQAGQPADQTMLTNCQAIGLLTQDLRLSSVGSSLLYEQTAAERRHITFAGRELRDE